jgi:hypothetical protein
VVRPNFISSPTTASLPHREKVMTVELVQDFIADEVRRQAARKTLIIAKSDKPDAIRVSGELDLYELAKAIMRMK